MEVYEYPGYRCGPCPPGLQGNGTHCDDINEVRNVGALEGTEKLRESCSKAEGFRRGQTPARAGRRRKIQGRLEGYRVKELGER